MNASDGFRWRLVTVLVVGASWCAPSHAFWGALANLGKAGSAAGKAAGAAGSVGKGAAVGVAGAELAEGASALKAASKLGGASADDLSRASGLGKAVPDEVAAMLHTPGKTLLDVPDPGTRGWLSLPRQSINPLHGQAMVHDYVRLLEGQAARGPVSHSTHSKATITNTKPRPEAAPQTALPTRYPANRVPWHAVELLARAAHAGHQGAQQELKRLCATPVTSSSSGTGAQPVHCAASKPPQPAPAKSGKTP